MLSGIQQKIWFRRQRLDLEGNPFLIVFHEEYDHRYFLCQTMEDLPAIALKVVKERLAEGMYEEVSDTKAIEFLHSLATTKDGWGALSFLSSRYNYEYEGFDITPFETMEGK